MRRIAIVIIAAGTLSACASMSPKECQSANWRDVGFSDAMKGRSVQLSDHREACAEVNITPNRPLYMSGYNAGSRQFCTYQSGLQFGKSGKLANNICTSPAQGKNFFRGYNKGKRIYNIKHQITLKQVEINKLDKKLSDIRKGKTKSGTGNLDLLHREKELINREIFSLTSELNRI